MNNMRENDIFITVRYAGASARYFCLQYNAMSFLDGQVVLCGVSFGGGFFIGPL
jgi:hypothetical protein